MTLHAALTQKSIQTTTMTLHAALTQKSIQATTMTLHGALTQKSIQATTMTLHGALTQKSIQTIHIKSTFGVSDLNSLDYFAKCSNCLPYNKTQHNDVQQLLNKIFSP
ncbi:hypothetical protein TNCV_4775081 [Trichonephila clavipes]|nr:hypothetical protein TNCV_4775081 [Trichonephila clavipes]